MRIFSLREEEGEIITPQINNDDCEETPSIRFNILLSHLRIEMEF